LDQLKSRIKHARQSISERGASSAAQYFQARSKLRD
jgi:hypothetical protein